MDCQRQPQRGTAAAVSALIVACVVAVSASGAGAQEVDPEPPAALEVTHLAADGIDADGDDSADETADAPGSATFTIGVTNTGDSVIPDVTIHDALPAGSWEIEPGGTDATCGSATSVEPGGGPNLQSAFCSFGDLAPSASRTMTVSRQLDPAADCGAELVNQVRVASGPLPAEPGPPDEATIRVRCAPGIRVAVTGPDLAHFGDRVSYDFTVSNPVGVDLFDVALDAPQCDEGSLTLVASDGADDVLAFGEVWSYRCSRLLSPDDVSLGVSSLCCVSPGGSTPVTIASNLVVDLSATVTARDEAVRSVSHVDSHRLAVISPAVGLSVGLDNDTPAVGDTLTYDFAVTNTGNTSLFDVIVTDDALGEIGTVSELAAGQTVNLTATRSVTADMPRRNVTTATGVDVLGLSVSDTDDVTIDAIVEGAVLTAGGTLPATGDGTDALLVLAGVLLALGGGALLLSTSRLVITDR